MPRSVIQADPNGVVGLDEHLIARARIGERVEETGREIHRFICKLENHPNIERAVLERSQRALRRRQITVGDQHRLTEGRIAGGEKICGRAYGGKIGRADRVIHRQGIFKRPEMERLPCGVSCLTGAKPNDRKKKYLTTATAYRCQGPKAKTRFIHLNILMIEVKLAELYLELNVFIPLFRAFMITFPNSNPFLILLPFRCLGCQLFQPSFGFAASE